jgi:multimeric flavodoxin WrbA
LLNLNPDKKDAEFEKYALEFKKGLELKLHSVEYLTVRDMDVKPCIGCWDCWVKTPGVCSLKDDVHKILTHINHNDLVVFAAPYAMGFMHSLAKTLQERMVPLLLPYSELIMGETRHTLRYGTTPELAFIYKGEADTDEEDVQINRDIFERFALNFRSTVIFYASTKKPAMELIHETVDF